MSRPPDAFSIVQRVRFGDLDAMQHMNNVEFLRYFETARIDFFRDIAPEHAPTERSDFAFIFAECHIAYRSPAVFDEPIRTFVWPVDVKRVSVRLAFEMVVEDRLVAEGWGTLVGYDYNGGRPRRIPRDLCEVLEARSSAPDAVG